MKEHNGQSKKPGAHRTILVAPLYWGLGHATRCIPIIRALLSENFNVLVASDGQALLLLRKEFPTLEYIELPSYNIKYSRKSRLFKLTLLLKLPHLWKTIRSEKRIVKELVEQGLINGIISDNRLGVHSKGVPSVFITHQLNVLSGTTSLLSSKAHQKIIDKFDQCWVPDSAGPQNLSGILGHLKKPIKTVRYIGPLSRMKPVDLPLKYDVMCLLSGPEPQRGMLEERCFSLFRESQLRVLIVRGVVEERSHLCKLGNLSVVNFLNSEALEQAINESEIVLSRSGYTTIMDLAILGKKAFFIPTPGQYEQEYLAKRLKQKGIVPSCKQEEFSIGKLSEVTVYTGFDRSYQEGDLSGLFRLFERK